ncbi:type II secretion system protein [Vibrio mediterranei]|uniref:PilW family protein n=1 Tax=Vibrio mediterranei TaxID=689 RepID=UPI0038CE9A68
MSFSVKQSGGFTLLEMIITMVVVGILFLGIAGFVEFGARGYVDSVARTKIQNQAQFVIEKMSRELRHAVPNSIQTSLNGQCVSYYPITFSGFYHLDEKLGKTEFVVGNIHQYPHKFANTERLIINPSRQQDLEGRRAISLAGVRLCGRSTIFYVKSIARTELGWAAFVYLQLSKQGRLLHHHVWSDRAKRYSCCHQYRPSKKQFYSP